MSGSPTVPAPAFTGRTKLACDTPSRSDACSKIMIVIEVSDLPPMLAMLDTGAPYLILPPSQAEALDLPEGDALEKVVLVIRGERWSGSLHRVPLRLRATEDGQDLELDATAFVPQADAASVEWGDTPAVVGYHACLDRIAFAVDGPNELICFGAGEVN